MVITFLFFFFFILCSKEILFIYLKGSNVSRPSLTCMFTNISDVMLVSRIICSRINCFNCRLNMLIMLTSSNKYLVLILWPIISFFFFGCRFPTKKKQKNTKGEKLRRFQISVSFVYFTYTTFKRGIKKHFHNSVV